MSKRLAQINQTLLKEISSIIIEVAQPEWGLITITDVLISPDLRQAKIWIATNNNKTITNLNDISMDIRETLRPRLKFKHVPFLEFHLDKGEINHIEELLEKIK
jgi:ribosome-binding factor A